MKLPVEQVDVLGDRYRVLVRKQKLFGECFVDTGKIVLRPDQTEDQARDTLLHEVLHAIEHVYSLKTSEKEIRLIATGLRAVFTSNPEFAKWVSK